jgi:Trk-type K+ transport system membrane component
MRKVQFLAVVWTLLLAGPFTVLAILSAAYLTENTTEIIQWFESMSQLTTVGGRGWIAEFSARWPELAGMIIGQLVLLTILIFARNMKLTEKTEKA